MLCQQNGNRIVTIDSLTSLRSNCIVFGNCLQTLASAATFVYSLYLLLHWQLLIMVVFATVGTVMFFEAERLAIVRAKWVVAEAIVATQTSL